MNTQAIGYGCAGVAILCFGSNFVVTKYSKTGDGACGPGPQG